MYYEPWLMWWGGRWGKSNEIFPILKVYMQVGLALTRLISTMLGLYKEDSVTSREIVKVSGGVDLEVWPLSSDQLTNIY